jgi:hypothetical protein
MTPEPASQIEMAAANITPEDLKGSGRKTAFVQFRVSEREKASLQQTAQSLGLQVSEYLLRIHELVSANLKKQPSANNGRS